MTFFSTLVEERERERRKRREREREKKEEGFTNLHCRITPPPYEIPGHDDAGGGGVGTGADVVRCFHLW